MSQIQIIQCVKCGKANKSKILDDGSIMPPEKCADPGCRMILDRCRVRKNNLKKMQNLRPSCNIIIYNMMRQTKQKKPKPKQYHFCPKCELFYDDAIALERHNQRRHPQ
jgi:hypothetical protein